MARKEALVQQLSRQLRQAERQHAARIASDCLHRQLRDIERRRALVASELQKVAERAQCIQQENRRRRAVLDEVHRGSSFHINASAFHSANLQYRLALQALALEKQRCIRLLRLALPLHWKKPHRASNRTSTSSEEPTLIRICGAVLPVGFSDSPAADSDATESAGLGLLSLFLELAARYLGCPLVHVGSFRGSRSTVWRRTSFYGDAGSREMPLFSCSDRLHDAAKDASSAGWPSNAALQQHVTTLARGVGRVLFDTPSPPSDWAASPHARLAAVHLLCRSVGLLCAHELGLAGVHAPPQWRPLALLAALCAGLAKPSTQQAGTLAAAGEDAGPPEAGGDDEADDWTHVEFSGLVPPPPFAEEEVKLWEQLAR